MPVIRLLSLLAVGLLLLATLVGNAQEPASRVWTAFAPGPAEPGLAAPFNSVHAVTLAADQKDEKSVRDFVDRTIETAMTSHQIAGAVVAVTDKGNLVVKKGYGKDPILSDVSADKGTPFVLGAASQVLTGYGAMILVGRGQLALTDPLGKYLASVPDDWRPITIEQLLTHKSGIPDFSRNSDSFQAALAEAEKSPLRFKPGTARRETDADFDVVGQVIQTAAGEPFLKFMREAVFKHLRMESSGDITMLGHRAGQSRGSGSNRPPSFSGNVYDNAASGSMLGLDPEVWQKTLSQLRKGLPEYSVPSRGMVASADDLVKLISPLLSGSLPGVPASPPYTSIAPGWRVCHSEDETFLIAHGLTASAYGTSLYILPSRRAALILLWNFRPGAVVVPLAEEETELLTRVFGVSVSSSTCP